MPILSPDLSKRPLAISLERHMEASPATLFRAWTQEIERWFAAPGTLPCFKGKYAGRNDLGQLAGDLIAIDMICEFTWGDFIVVERKGLEVNIQNNWAELLCDHVL